MHSYENHHSSGSVNFTHLNLPRLRRIYNQRRFVHNLIFTPVFIVVSVFAVNMFTQISHKNSDYAHAKTKTAEAIVIPSPTVHILSQNYPSVQTSKLKTIVEDELRGTSGQYAIVVRNLKTGESYFKNEHQTFQSASLYKLWIMAVVYKQIAEGKISLNDTLSAEVPELNKRFNLATEEAELTEGVVTFTIQNALEEMVTNSHNYAALLLSAKVGISNVSKFLKENNLHDSRTGEPPKTTASDMAIFFEKLYRGELNNSLYTAEMTALLKRQNLNSVIPKYLPQEVEIAHKTGQIYTVSHDAGIIFSKKGNYIFVGMSNSNSYRDAEERIARVSEAVFNYFEERN